MAEKKQQGKGFITAGRRDSEYPSGSRLQAVTGIGRAEDVAKCGHDTGHFVNTITKLKMNFRGGGSECFLESGVSFTNELMKEKST